MKLGDKVRLRPLYPGSVSTLSGTDDRSYFIIVIVKSQAGLLLLSHRDLTDDKACMP
jgi:hypothetical protein